MAIYFAVSLTGLASDAVRLDSSAARMVLTQPAPGDGDAYARIATQLSVLRLYEVKKRLDTWMERHVWLRLLERPDPLPATVADAVAAGHEDQAMLQE